MTNLVRPFCVNCIICGVLLNTIGFLIVKNAERHFLQGEKTEKSERIFDLHCRRANCFAVAGICSLLLAAFVFLPSAALFLVTGMSLFLIVYYYIEHKNI